MVDREPFAQLRFQGERFEAATLPVDVVGSLPVYQEILIELAKKLWKDRNPAGSRLPAGFDRSLNLVFEKVTDGSAVAHLPRVDRSELSLGFGSDVSDIFEEAQTYFDKILIAANNNEPILETPDEFRALIGRFGRGLQGAEKIEVRSKVAIRNAQPGLTFSSRTKDVLLKKIVSKDSQYIEGFGLIGAIDQINSRVTVVSDVGSFGVSMDWESLISRYSRSLNSVVEFAIDFDITESGKLKVKELRSFDLLQTSIVVDKFIERLKDLSSLDDGWLDGLGHSISQAILLRSEAVGRYILSIYDELYCYPTEAGGIRLEFQSSSFDVGLEVKKEHILLELLNLESGEFGTRAFFSLDPSLLENIGDLGSMKLDE